MISPDQVQRLLKQALTLQRAGRSDRADALFRQVRAAAPGNFDVLQSSGLFAIEQGRHAEAAETLGAALRINPRSAVCAMRLGYALVAAGRNAEAERPLRVAAQLDPRNSECWDILARCLLLQDKLRAAIECHKRAVSISPDDTPFWNSYGTTLLQFGEVDEALSCFKRALSIDPSFAKGHYGMAQALFRSHRIPEAIEAYDRYLSKEPGNISARSFRLFALNNLEGLTREKLFAEHLAYGRLVGTRSAPIFPNPPDPSRRIRVGILSPDLREHACVYFLEPLLRQLDRSQFEVYLYHDHYKEDACSERLRCYASVWRNFVGQPGDDVERTIRGDAPDILVDLAGHVAISNRLPLFARHLAPVQVTYLGYPNTTGVPGMGYRFVDGIVDPEGDADAYASETLVRFAPTAWSYLPPPDAPTVGEGASREAGTVVFGCFNSPGKMTDVAFSTWGRLLQSVPGSRLLLKGAGLASATSRDYWSERLRSCGLPLERVDLVDRTRGVHEHLSQYDRVDVALDTFPYNGTTTTCEALWMGVPVVTLKGDRHSARVGASLLTAVGRPEWIANSEEEYLRIAATLATSAASRRGKRGELRSEMQASPLLDHAGQAARFGSALRDCWERWCRQADPRAQAAPRSQCGSVVGESGAEANAAWSLSGLLA